MFRKTLGYLNGNTRDRLGRLLTCEMGPRWLTRTEHDGTLSVLADSFEGTRLTGPNDVIVKSDGSIWFSDNGAGIRGSYLGNKPSQELPFRVLSYRQRHGRANDCGGRHGAAKQVVLFAR